MNNPNPVAFTIAGHPIMWYGILITLGVVLGVSLAMRAAPKYGWASDDIVDASLIGVPLAIIGARLYFILFFDLQYYLAHPSHIIRTWEGGLAIYGGLLGGLLGGVIYCRWKKKSIIELFDIIVPSFALGQAIGRWGNFFNQEAFGPAVTNPAHMWFPLSVLIDETRTVHYATFFYESMWCLLILVFLLTQRKRFKHSGDVFLAYAFLYSFERMLIESLRTDSLMFGPLRVSQLLSAVVFFGVSLFWLLRWNKERSQPVVITNKLNPLYQAPIVEADPSTDGPAEAADLPDGIVLPFDVEDEIDDAESPVAIEEEHIDGEGCEESVIYESDREANETQDEESDEKPAE